MSADAECSHCGLLNPPGAQKCDCGYDFVTGAGPAHAAKNSGAKDGIKAYELAASILIPVLGIALGVYALIRRRILPAFLMIGFAVAVALFFNVMPVMILVAAIIERISPAVPR